jgi:hypothetical protein
MHTTHLAILVLNSNASRQRKDEGNTSSAANELCRRAIRGWQVNLATKTRTNYVKYAYP